MAIQNAVGFDPTTTNSNLFALTVNNTILQTAVANVARTFVARSQFGISTSTTRQPNVEAYLYSPDTVKPSLATVGGVPVGGFGFIDAAGTLTNWFGSDAHGWNYAPDGTLYHSGASIATFATYTYGDFISVTFDMPNLQATFSKNGVVQGSVTLTAATTYYYAASMSAAAQAISAGG
jgi:hypothetical protein